MKGKKLTLEEFIQKSNNVHSYKYDYSKSKFSITAEKVLILCPIHGEFLQIASSHLSGRGCPKCAKEILIHCRRSTKEEFIEKVNERHNYKYDYSRVVYKNNNTKVQIICPEHGIFEQTPRGHLTYGCPKCHLRGYDRESWIKIAIKNKNSKLYIIECFNNEEKFIKIGITSRSLKERFGGKEMPYNYKIIMIYEYSPEIIWDFEKELHKLYSKDYQYIPKIPFNGMYECYNMWITETLYPRIFD